jgi:hypothetical protein
MKEGQWTDLRGNGDRRLTEQASPRRWASVRAAHRRGAVGAAEIGAGVVGDVLRGGTVLEDGSTGWFHGQRCRSVWRRFSVATAARGSLRRLPGAVPVFEAKTRSRMTPRGTRRWLLQRLRRGDPALGRGAQRAEVNERGESEGARMATTLVEEGIRATTNVAHMGRQVHVGSGGLEHGVERLASGARASDVWPAAIVRAV